jgi:hypothetical protein
LPERLMAEVRPQARQHFIRRITRDAHGRRRWHRRAGSSISQFLPHRKSGQY